MRSAAFAIAASLTLVGCAAMPGLQPPVAPSTPYIPADHDEWRGEGTATLTGQAFLRQQGGGVVTCAGSDVILLPKSAYFDEIASIVKSRRRVDPAHMDKADVPGRRSQCDAQGNFRFENLPAATWYLITKVQWTIGYAPQGGELMRVVTTTNGRTENVLLSDQDRQ